MNVHLLKSIRQIKAENYHRPLPNPEMVDRPSLEDDSKMLFTIQYVVLIRNIADCMFPPNTVTTDAGNKVTISASDALIERYVFFRSVWQPEWGQRIHLVLKQLTTSCIAKYGDHFSVLDESVKTLCLADLEKENYTKTEWPYQDRQKQAFNLIQQTMTEGFFGEPGYGGNDSGLGWYYSNFLTIRE